jgi:hypothetical protein
MPGRGRPRRAPKRPARLRSASPPRQARRGTEEEPPQPLQEPVAGPSSEGPDVWWSTPLTQPTAPAVPPAAPAVQPTAPAVQPAAPAVHLIAPPPQGTLYASDPAVMARIQALEQALADKHSYGTGHKLENLPISVPVDLKTKIVEGKCIDMGALLPKSFLERQDEAPMFVQDSQGRLVPKPGKKQKAPLTIEQWTTAFTIYMSVYLTCHPGELQPILAYFALIRKAAAENAGNGWALYDAEFRARKEAVPRRPWGFMDNELWLCLFSQSPNPTEGLQRPLLAKAEQGPQPPRTALCRFYNRPKGCFRQNCTYAHKCGECFVAGHTSVACKTKNKPRREDAGPSRPSYDTGTSRPPHDAGRPPFRIGAGHRMSEGQRL